MFDDGRQTHKNKLHWPHSPASPEIIYQHLDIPELLTLPDLKSAHTAAFPYTRKFHLIGSTTELDTSAPQILFIHCDVQKEL